MKQSMKQELEKYFQAPNPTGKRAFLRSLGMQKMSLWHVFYTQLYYIPRWVWLVFGIFFLAAWFLGRFLPEAAMGSIMALVPFLVMVSVAESFRSVSYGMQELELAARFPLQSIVLARMGILGAANLMLLLCVTVMIGKDLFRDTLFLLVPYLVTALGGLIIVRRIAGKDGIFVCAGFAVGVSAVNMFLHNRASICYEDKYLAIWLLLFFLLCAMVYMESRKAVRFMGELL